MASALAEDPKIVGLTIIESMKMQSKNRRRRFANTIGCHISALNVLILSKAELYFRVGLFVYTHCIGC